MSEIRVEPVAYDIDGQPYEGQLVYDASHAGPRPGLLMAPNWMGVSAAALDIARQVAGRGHVVLVRTSTAGTCVRRTATRRARR